jgi:hypothetical protein
MKPKAAIRKLTQKTRRGLKSSEDSSVAMIFGSKSKNNVLTNKEIKRSEVTDQTTFAHGDSMLHMLCRYHPPVSAVRNVLSQRAPLLAVHEVNSAGQTPLHVAAACGASFQVVRLLLDQCPETAGAQDSQGDTPLHLHIANTCRKNICDPGFMVPKQTIRSTQNSSRGKQTIPSSSKKGSSSNTALTGRSSGLSASNTYDKEKRGLTKASKRDSLAGIKKAIGESKHKEDVEKLLVVGPTQEIIDTLAKAAPYCVMVENDKGASVIELAIVCDADLKTVEKLQDIARSHVKTCNTQLRGSSSMPPYHRNVRSAAALAA